MKSENLKEVVKEELDRYGRNRIDGEQVGTTDLSDAKALERKRNQTSYENNLLLVKLEEQFKQIRADISTHMLLAVNTTSIEV